MFSGKPASAISRFMQTLWKPFQPFYQRAIGQYIDILAKAYPYPVKVLGMFLKGFAGLSGVLFVLYLLILLGAFGLVPNRGELKAVQNYTASEVYSQDSILLGKFFLENRTNAEFEDLPEDLIHALVSTEDARFYSHDGVD
ncbi:MAG TPA: transglycosylase domain-containing protein, partial [Chitinophagales bacterium]|nr:transglycosylase domain-containing protein [Chitinophagales bacterium]